MGERKRKKKRTCQVSWVKIIYRVLLWPHFYFTSIGFGLELPVQAEKLHQSKDWTTIFCMSLQIGRNSQEHQRLFGVGADLWSTLAPECCQDTCNKSERQFSHFSSQQQTEQRPNRRRAVNPDRISKPHFLRALEHFWTSPWRAAHSSVVHIQENECEDFRSSGATFRVLVLSRSTVRCLQKVRD